MPLILWLFVSTAAQPLPPEAASWLGDAVVLEQRVVELPRDQRLLYLLKGSGGFEDGFFVVDAKNAVTGWPTLRDGSASDIGVSTYAGGCPLPGHVEALTVTAAFNIELRGESLSCVVRTGPEGLVVFPNLNVSFADNYPDARAGIERFNSALYTFYPLPGSSAVLASASEKCDLVIFDRETGIIDDAASASASEVICQSALTSCLEYRQSPLGVGFGLQGDTLISSACSDGGSAGCYAYCLFDSLQASCVEEGCHHSPAMMEALEAAKTEDDRQREKHEHEVRAAGEQALEKRAAIETLEVLLETTARAKALWRMKRRDEALELWRQVYRRWVEAGRPAEPEATLNPLEGVLKYVGRPVDMSRVRVDTMIEALNDLGFALWATGQAHQAKGALTECQALLTRSAGSRPLLELNLGDVEKDLGNVAAAREHYETFLKLPSSAKQRAAAQASLRALVSSRP